MDEKPSPAFLTRRSEFAGTGALVQAAGIGLLILLSVIGATVGFLIGLFLCVAFLIIGSRMSQRWTCSACGNRLDGDHARLCPTCKAELKAQPSLFDHGI